MSEVGQDNMDAEVVLTVSGLFDADVQAAFTDTSAALKRGGTHSARSAQRLLLVGIVGGTAAAVVLGTVIALYLLGLASEGGAGNIRDGRRLDWPPRLGVGLPIA